MNNYVILGNGNSSDNVIEDGLADLPLPCTFYFHSSRTGADGVARVYDWMLDNKAKYIAYYKESAPTVMLENAIKSVDSLDPVKELCEFAKSSKATILYLWNAENEKQSEKEVTKLVDLGVRVLDLTQGLTPFLIVESDDVENKTKDSLPPLTLKEYQAMPQSALTQQAKAHGLDTDMERSLLIKTMLGDSESNQKSKDDVVVLVAVYSDQTTKVVECSKKQVTEFLNSLK